MKKTFKDVLIGEVFSVPNKQEILTNRGPISFPWGCVEHTIRFKKRDAQGATSFYDVGYHNLIDGCYYRIDADNVVIQ